MSVQKHEASSGGARLTGLKDSNGDDSGALMLRGVLGEAAKTAKSASGWGVVNVYSNIKSGTSTAAVGVNGNLFAIANDTSVKAIINAYD